MGNRFWGKERGIEFFRMKKAKRRNLPDGNIYQDWILLRNWSGHCPTDACLGYPRQSSAIIELYHVATELTERLQRSGFKENTLTLKIKLHDFNQKTKSITPNHELTTLNEILLLGKGLLKEIEYTTHPIAWSDYQSPTPSRRKRGESPLGTTEFRVND